MTPVSARWFTQLQGCIGIVKVIDGNGAIRYYIGQASGVDEKDDMQQIAMTGARFFYSAGKVLFGDK